MKIKELREMSGEQRKTTLEETQKKLFDLRVQARMEKLDSPSEVVKARKLIARIKTIENENRQLSDTSRKPQNQD
ncbi:MAG: 50S ribosomal protein L29 [Planctomycetia bacterium]|nr:50S ribosomal protein L29 [Planctomycetia bacterium]